jgi:hypothetical protein
MTRNLIALASRMIRTERTRKASPRHRRAGLKIESLEARLALSSVTAAPVPLDLNPQPYPPGYMAVVRSWTPDLGIVGNHIGTSVATPDIKGEHVGS